MNYRDFIQFDPVEDVVRLQDASQQDGARRLVSSYRFSEEMAGQLTSLVFPRLQLDEPADPKALWVVGCSGTGKTHLLSVISILAERAELASAVTSPKALEVDEAARAKGSAGVDAVAGRFKVIRVEIGPTNKPLRDVLLGQIDNYLTAQGVTYFFPPADKAQGIQPAFHEMMAAFHGKFPQHGLLLVVDDLADYLRTRKDQKLIGDLDFLVELAEVSRDLKFRFMASLDEDIFDNPRVEFAGEFLGRIQDRSEVVRIGPGQVRFVLTERLVRKTPAQRTQVEEHLARFARFYGTMQDRIDDFVALFPIHPDYPEVFEKVAFAGKGHLLRTLSEAVEELLDEAVPKDRPGLLAYDGCWDKLRNHPESGDTPEIEAVTEFSRALERRMEKAPLPAEDKSMARRIIHALSVHRLTTGDIYNQAGATPTELRDMLPVPPRVGGNRGRAGRPVAGQSSRSPG